MADALGVSAGDVVTVLQMLDDGLDVDGPLPEWAAVEARAILDGGFACWRSVPEGYLPPDFALSDDWRSLGPADDDPRHV